MLKEFVARRRRHPAPAYLCRPSHGVALPTASLSVLLIVWLAPLLLAACQSAPSAPTHASPIVQATRVATTLGAATTPTRPPSGPASYTAITLLQPITSPDDLVFDAQGRLLAVDSSGNLYVSEQDAHRIVEFVRQ